MKAILFCLLLFTCVTADKDEQNVNLDRSMTSVSPTGFEELINLNTEQSEITILNLEPKGDFFKTFLQNIIVDNERAAITHLSASYRIAMVTIRNKKKHPIVLTDKSFTYQEKNIDYRPVNSLKQYPRTLGCINWKGNIKNLYNTAVITSTTVFVVGAFVVCAKGGKCEALNQSDKVVKLSTAGETDPDKTFSAPLFESQFTYSDIIDLEFPLSLESLEVKQGMLLYKKPNDWQDSRKAILSANCLVQ